MTCFSVQNNLKVLHMQLAEREYASVAADFREVSMRDHTKLRAFELADDLAVAIYRLTRDFPKDEIYGITSQMRRAAVSVPSNIVEGAARESESEYLRFLEIAFGSLRELPYQFSLSQRLGYVQNTLDSSCEPLLVEAGKVLAALIRSLRSPRQTP